MFVVGLTGGLGTGKSTVAAMFQRLGAEVINADTIVHELLGKKGGCYSAVIRAFGKEVAGKDGIDRRKLASLVFNNKQKLKKLEAIVHPKVLIEIKRRLNIYREKAFRGIVIVEVPLLFEAGFDRYVDTAVVVAAKQQKQLERSQKHLKLTRTEALRRIKAQMPLRDKIRLADIIIDNSGTKTQTLKQVKRICQKLTQRVKK